MKLKRKKKLGATKNILSKLLILFFVIVYFIFSFYWTFIVFDYNKSKFFIYFGLIVLFVVCFVLIFLFCKKFLSRKIKLNFKIKKNIILISLIILSLILRVLLLIFDYNEPQSDYATFYYNAIHVATGEGTLSSQYISAFPYLYGYIYVLGQFMKLIGTTYNGVIFFNIILDLLGALFIYLFSKKVFNKNLATVSLLVWLFNPFSIYFSVICSPIIILNTFFALCLYLASLFVTNLNNRKKVVIYGLLLGTFLSITNIFRPIMIILIIAIFIYLVYLLTKKHKNIALNIVIGFLLLYCSYQIGNKLYYWTVSDVTGYKITKSLPGWSIYVGSNILSNGEWSTMNIEIYDKNFYAKDYNPAKFSDTFVKLGIERYKSNGIRNNINLFVNKSYVLGSKTNEYSYASFKNHYINEDNSHILTFVNIYTNLFWYMLVIFNFIFAIINIKYKDEKLIPYYLLVIGLCVSTLLVEVSPRYFFPMFVPLCFISSISIYNLIVFIKEKLKYILKKSY